MPISTDQLVFARDASGDLIVPLRAATGLEATLIFARDALLTWRGEWFLDRTYGTPWLETEDGTVPERDAILGQAYDEGKTIRTLRGVLLAVPNVVEVPLLRCAFDGETRNLAVTFRLRTRFGDTEETTVVLAV